MKKLAIGVACICLFCIPATLSAQSNTGTSQTGRTEIDATRETTRVPFVNLNIREPQNNREVALLKGAAEWKTLLPDYSEVRGYSD